MESSTRTGLKFVASELVDSVHVPPLTISPGAAPALPAAASPPPLAAAGAWAGATGTGCAQPATSTASMASSTPKERNLRDRFWDISSSFLCYERLKILVVLRNLGFCGRRVLNKGAWFSPAPVTHILTTSLDLHQITYNPTYRLTPGESSVSALQPACSCRRRQPCGRRPSARVASLQMRARLPCRYPGPAGSGGESDSLKGDSAAKAPRP